MSRRSSSSRRSGAARPSVLVVAAVVALGAALDAAPAVAGAPAACSATAKAAIARVQLFSDGNCRGASVVVPKTGEANRPVLASFRNYDGTIRNVDNSMSSLAIDRGTCVRLFDGRNYTGPASTNICAGSRVVFWNLRRFDNRASSMRVCATTGPAACNAPPPVSAPAPPAAPNQSGKVLTWAYRHVGHWAGLYSMSHRLPTRSVGYMQTHEPPRGRGTANDVKQGCDCSSFVRWAVAQAGIDAGHTTNSLWTGNSRLGPPKPANASVNGRSGHAARGWGNVPPGGYHPGDLIFYGVTGMTRGTGHVALYMGSGRIVQCSGDRGSNMGSALGSQGRPLGWVRYDRISG